MPSYVTLYCQPARRGGGAGGLRIGRQFRDVRLFLFFFFFNDTPTPEIYPLSLHDALPIFGREALEELLEQIPVAGGELLERSPLEALDRKSGSAGKPRTISDAGFCLE